MQKAYSKYALQDDTIQAGAFVKLTDLISKINAENMQIRRAGSKGRVESTASAGTSSADRVELSSNSKDAQKIAEILNATPDVRIDKVTALKEQVERGEYRVDSLQVADKLIHSLLSDDFLNG